MEGDNDLGSGLGRVWVNGGGLESSNQIYDWRHKLENDGMEHY